MMNDTMTTAAMVVAELNVRGLETRPLTGREFPVPLDVAADAAYRWRLLSLEACTRILRVAFPNEDAKLVAHWASAEDIRRFSGELGERIRAAVAAAVCPASDPLQDAVLGRRLQHAAAGMTRVPVRDLRPLDVVRAPKRAARRSAEKQEMIDALELANMGRMFA